MSQACRKVVACDKVVPCKSAFSNPNGRHPFKCCASEMAAFFMKIKKREGFFSETRFSTVRKENYFFIVISTN